MARSSFGHIQKLSRGKYRAWWYEGDKRHSKRCDNLNDAKEAIARAELLSGHINYTTKYNEYYKTVVKASYKHLSKRSIHDLELAWKDLKPIIGNRKITDTNWHFVQSVIDTINAPSRQRRALAFWRRMLNFAVRDRIIRINPCCEGIKLKKRNIREKDLYTKEELCEILNIIWDTEFALPVLLECCCGLRHEEFCGLNKRDFEFEEENGWCIVSINKALTNVGGSKVLKDTKTDTSKRYVCLDKSFNKFCKENLSYMKNKRYIKEYYDPCKLSRKWKAYCEENNLKYVPFGQMRSVYATLSAEAGCLDSIVSKSMGHSGGSVKAKNYQKATLKALKINAEIFAEYVAFKCQFCAS